MRWLGDARSLARSLAPLLTPLLAMVLTLAGCAGAEAPRANRALRQVALTSSTDLEAYEVADAVDDQLRDWCAQALAVRQEGEVLAVDHPIVDGRADAELARLRAAAESADGEELAASLDAFVRAHEDRLAVLVAGPRFSARRYARADRRVAELSFGLRRWRLQR